MKFVATSRALQGTGASRRLRNSGKTPGIVFGAGVEPQTIELEHNALFHALKKEEAHTSVLALEVDGKEVKAVLRDVQFHPYKPLVLHVDFQRVDETTKIESKVALRYEGIEASPAVKEECTVTPLITEVSVMAVPSNTPEFITVDLSNLTAKAVPGLQSVKTPAGVKIIARGANKNPALVNVKLPERAVEAAAAAPVAEKKKGKK